MILLSVGDNGEQVFRLQQQLVAAGLDPGPVDGIYGLLTRMAVKQLQRICRLVEDGVAGPKTVRGLAFFVPHDPVGQARLSDHFAEQEFACRCCGKVRANIYLIEKLEKLRRYLGGRPIIVTSGYRCPGHNGSVGGARESLHLTGSAADIVVAGVQPSRVVSAAKIVGFSGLGRYSAFTHVDVRLGEPAIWDG